MTTGRINQVTIRPRAFALAAVLNPKAPNVGYGVSLLRSSLRDTPVASQPGFSVRNT